MENGKRLLNPTSPDTQTCSKSVLRRLHIQLEPGVYGVEQPDYEVDLPHLCKVCKAIGFEPTDRGCTFCDAPEYRE